MLLIDLSYYVFYRYYATLHWFKLKNPDVDPNVSNVLDNVEFMHSYYHHIDEDVKKWKKKYPGHKIVFCKDCKRDDIWRMSHHGVYKATREHAASFQGEIFPFTFRYLETLGYSLVGHDFLEADDIAYILQEYVTERDTETNIVIITNDNDYLQIDNPRVTIFNMQGKDIRTRGCGSARKDMMKKILMGDKSDNIPAVMKGLGPKTADKLLLLSDEQIVDWIRTKGGQDAIDTFHKNRLLIDMSQIPTELKNAFLGKLEKMKLI